MKKFLFLFLIPICYGQIIKQKDSILEIKDVLVVGGKVESAASSIHINQSGFINRPRNSSQDLLRAVPGLFIAQHAGGGKAEQIFIRGFDCDHGTDIATFVDGMPVNMPSHGHGQGYADLHFLMPEIVKSISVFKGCSSVQFGDFATGAAVGFQTFDSLSAQRYGIETSVLSGIRPIASSRLYCLLNLPIQSKKIRSYFAVDGLIAPGYFDKNQFLKRYTSFLKTTFQLTNNSQLKISISSFGSSWDASGQIPERAILNGTISRFGCIDPNEGGNTSRQNIIANYSKKGNNSSLVFMAYGTAYHFQLYSNFTFYLVDSLNGDMIEQDDNRYVLGTQVNWNNAHKLFGQSAVITSGYCLRNDYIENQLWHAPKRIREKAVSLTNEQLLQQGFFINEAIFFSLKFRLDLGIRYDILSVHVQDQILQDAQHQSISGTAFQSGLHPKLNLSYAYNKNWQYFLNSGSGYHSNDARSMSLSQTQIKLPLAVSSEIGFIKKNKSGYISAALWELEMSNEIVYIGDEGTTETNGSSRRFGCDFSIRTNLMQNIYIDFDLNLAKNRYTTGLWKATELNHYFIPLSPRLTSVGGIGGSWQNGFEASLRYRYLMQRPANDNATIIAKGYCVLDAFFAYKRQQCRLSFTIENLLNTNWNEAQFATLSKLQNEQHPIEELNFTPGTPLNLKISLNYSFK